MGNRRLIAQIRKPRRHNRFYLTLGKTPFGQLISNSIQWWGTVQKAVELISKPIGYACYQGPILSRVCLRSMRSQFCVNSL